MIITGAKFIFKLELVPRSTKNPADFDSIIYCHKVGSDIESSGSICENPDDNIDPVHI